MHGDEEVEAQESPKKSLKRSVVVTSPEDKATQPVLDSSVTTRNLKMTSSHKVSIESTVTSRNRKLTSTSKCKHKSKIAMDNVSRIV